MRGVYVLLLSVTHSLRLRVGALGLLRFKPGTYAYVGSALGSLERRLSRHTSKRKKLHWHIDRLTVSNAVKPRYVIWAATSSKHECSVSKGLSSVPYAQPVPGFGSSDCASGCESHLYLLNAPPVKIILHVRTVFEKSGMRPKTIQLRGAI
jgi:Uri superfamily endonuclease